jgi:anti-sigma regulatory factor (Ser/Thr protein kinase)
MTDSLSAQVSERTFPADTSSIGEARRFVREVTSGAIERVGPVSDLRGDLELAVSELVTNAVEHGHQEPVTVRVSVAPVAVTVSVRSVRTTKEISDPSTWAGPLPAMRTGRGLAIVRSVSDDVAVEADDSMVTVHCTFRTA